MYYTKILFTVLPSDSALSSPFALATGTPYAAIKNGSALDIAVTLQGNGKSPADEQDIAWVHIMERTYQFRQTAKSEMIPKGS